MGNIDNEKLKAIESAMSQIEKQFGKGSVMKLGENNILNMSYINWMFRFRYSTWNRWSTKRKNNRNLWTRDFR